MRLAARSGRKGHFHFPMCTITVEFHGKGNSSILDPIHRGKREEVIFLSMAIFLDLLVSPPRETQQRCPHQVRHKKYQLFMDSPGN